MINWKFQTDPNRALFPISGDSVPFGENRYTGWDCLFCSGNCSQVEVFSRQLCRSSSGLDSWDHAEVENVTQECCRRSCSPQFSEHRTISGRKSEVSLYFIVVLITVFHIDALLSIWRRLPFAFRWASRLRSNSASLYSEGSALLQEIGTLTLNKVSVMQSLQPRQHRSHDSCAWCLLFVLYFFQIVSTVNCGECNNLCQVKLLTDTEPVGSVQASVTTPDWDAWLCKWLRFFRW